MFCYKKYFIHIHLLWHKKWQSINVLNSRKSFEFENVHLTYRIMGYFRVAKFSRLCLENMGIIFRGRQRPRKIISILFRENLRVGGITRFSLNRLTVRKKISGQSNLKRNGIKDTCSLTDKQTKRTDLHSDGWIKWLFRTKQWNVCLACLLCCVIRHFLP